MQLSSTPAPALLAALSIAGCAAPAAETVPDPPEALPGLWEITEGPGAPFLLSPPAGRDPAAAVVLFVPGGAGIRDHALPTFERWLAAGDGRDELWLLLPYATGSDLAAEEARVQAALERVLAERAPDARAVHLAGTSNGGRTAFRWMLAHPERWASFLGAPALPPADTTDEALVAALGDKPVMLAVGEQDAGEHGWLDPVRALAERLAALGVDGELAVLPGEEHILTEEFDETLFLDFWLGRRAATRADSSNPSTSTPR